MGRHALARKRQRSPAVLAAFLAPAAVFFAAGADVRPGAPNATGPEPVVAEPPPCCVEVVAAAPVGQSYAGPVSAARGQVTPASRWRVIDIPQLLPVGAAPETGLQIKTILAARSISAVFPEIDNIGGYRPDPLRWHPHGLAIDVMIPNHGTAAGIALGNQVVAYVLKNAERFGLEHIIWRGVYYTPAGPQGPGSGHYDHVHIATTGGGYPTGAETYIR